jgi:YHS domain-containing protein
MRNFFAMISMLALLATASCGNSEDKGQTTSEDIDQMQEGDKLPTLAEVAGKIDPVCEMEKDNTWTDYSVYKSDTVSFCSTGCKQAFDARPTKYISEN